MLYCQRIFLTLSRYDDIGHDDKNIIRKRLALSLIRKSPIFHHWRIDNTNAHACRILSLIYPVKRGMLFIPVEVFGDTSYQID